MKKDHIFRIVNNFDSNIIFPSVEMELDSQASLSDLLDALTSFIRAIGYCPKENSYLTFVSDDESIYEEIEIEENI